MKKGKNRFLGSKKGNAILDVIFIIIFIFGFALSTIIGYKFFLDINEDLQDQDTFNNQSKEILNDLEGKYPSLFDGAFLVILIFLWIAGIVASFMVDTNPIFLVATVVMMVFVLFLATVFSNAYEEVTDNDGLYSATQEFPITDFLMGNLYTIALIMGMTIIIVLFGKFKAGGGLLEWMER
jgi:hypothetical protein